MVCRYGIYHAGWLPGEKSSSCAAIVVKRELWRVFKCVGPKWPQNAILDHIPPVSLSSLLRNPVPEDFSRSAPERTTFSVVEKHVKLAQSSFHFTLPEQPCFNSFGARIQCPLYLLISIVI